MRGDAYHLIGGNGGTFYNSSDGAISGVKVTLKAVNGADVVLSSLTSENMTNASRVTTIPSGHTLEGIYTGFTITSGVLAAYNAR